MFLLEPDFAHHELGAGPHRVSRPLGRLLEIGHGLFQLIELLFGAASFEIGFRQVVAVGKLFHDDIQERDALGAFVQLQGGLARVHLPEDGDLWRGGFPRHRFHECGQCFLVIFHAEQAFPFHEAGVGRERAVRMGLQLRLNCSNDCGYCCNWYSAQPSL